MHWKSSILFSLQDIWKRIADRVVNIGERVIFINTHKRPHIEELKKKNNKLIILNNQSYFIFLS